MDAPLKARLGDALVAKLSEVTGEANYAVIDTVDRARFFGRLMLSALGTRSFTDAIESGEIVAYAVVTLDTVIGVGVEVTRDGHLEPVQRAFTYRNAHTTVTDVVDAAWREVLAAHQPQPGT